MHCQICLTPVPDHSPNCPVKTGQSVMGGDQLEWVQRMPQGPQGLMGDGSMAMMGGSWQLQRSHDPVAAELRIERLERELAQLQARVAKLERKP